MKFIPILFSTPMVQALLAGRKTMTRRIVKTAEGWDHNWKVSPIKEEHTDGVQRYEMRCGTQYALPWFKCPYGQTGDVLWVRETWQPYLRGTESGGHVELVKFIADGFEVECKHKEKWDDFKVRPSIFMPKQACRIFLEVTNVRAERLHDISEHDCMCEGYDIRESRDHGSFPWFKNLWQKINGKESWDANPWLWVVEFKRIERPANFLV